MNNVPPNNTDGHFDVNEDGHARHSGNPYLQNQAKRDAEPDLDQGAAELVELDAQRLNRKAILFLAALAATLLIFGLLIAKSFSSRGEKPKPKREEAVVVPELRQVAPPVEPALPPPIALARDLPPMPEPPEPAPLPPSLQKYERDAGPSLLDRRIMAVSGGGDGHASGLDLINESGTPGMPLQATAQARVEKSASARYLQKPDYLLVRGTYIRCILESRIISDFNGFTSCVVTEPVYSINGARLLIPKGSKVVGSYQGGANRGARVSVIWDRITTPRGVDIAMSSPGVDGLGGAGVPGQYDAHWGARIGSALLISLISDGFKYAAAENGPSSYAYGGGGNMIVEQPYESATARTMERMANQALDESMAQRRPTVTVNQGALINVYVSQDVDFSSVSSQ